MTKEELFAKIEEAYSVSCDIFDENNAIRSCVTSLFELCITSNNYKELIDEYFDKLLSYCDVAIENGITLDEYSLNCVEYTQIALPGGLAKDTHPEWDDNLYYEVISYVCDKTRTIKDQLWEKHTLKHRIFQKLKHIIEAIKPIRNVIYYLLLIFAINFLVQNGNDFASLLREMPIWKCTMYGVSIIMYLFLYCAFWWMEFRGEHITYGYINVNGIIVKQRNDILYSIVLMLIETDIVFLRKALPILSVMLIIKSIFWTPFCFKIAMSVDE